MTRVANIKGFGNLHKATCNILNKFIPKVVKPAVQLYSTQKNVVAKRTITLESIPPIYTPLRGALAGDCSMVSVPYYGLHNKVRTFWIRKSCDYDSKPLGYVIIIEIATATSFQPYILTINGPTLKTIDCEAIFALISKQYKNKEVYLSDLNKNYYYVNTSSIAKAFTHAEGHAKTIDLPAGWEILDSLRFEYENYYRSSQSCYVKEVTNINLSMIDKWHDEQCVQAYVVPNDILSMPKLTRAVLYHYYQRTDVAVGDVENVQQHLCLSDDDVGAVCEMLLVYRDEQITPEILKQLNQSFGFGLKEFSKLKLSARASVLRWIYDECFDMFSESDWITVITNINDEINIEILSESYNDDTLDHFKDYKASLPDVYLPNYWQEIEPLLYLKNGMPNHYLCKRFVKSFYSVATIEAFIDYLLNNEGVLRGLDSEYDRWSDFFIRAMTLLDDTSKTEQAISITYLDHLRNTELYHTPYHIAVTLVQYERILGRRDEGLMAELKALHFANEEIIDKFAKEYEKSSGKYM